MIAEQATQLHQIRREMSQLKYRLSPETLWSHLYSALVESTIRDKTMLDAKSKRVVILKLKKGIN